ncbi:MAG: cell division protein ZapA [Candidatus Competibacteraceae bacterium]|nr:cell division protein ZapA [Candidatus Competibacteraceae bacterium]
MSERQVQVSLQILDNEYRVACPANERESLLAAANHVNDRMQEIRASGRILGQERIAVMTALQLAYELLGTRRQLSELDEATSGRLEEILRKVDGTLNKAAQMEV